MSAFHPLQTLAPVRAAVRLKSRARRVSAPQGQPILKREFGSADARKQTGESIMQRIVFACAAFMILASPLGAQQTPPDQSVPVPPTAPEPPPELPPPFV